jgi:hypothetical protein
LNGTTHGFCAVRISEKNTKGKELEKGHLDKLTEAYKPRHYGETIQIQKMATELTKQEQISEELHKMEEAGQIEEKFYGNLRRYWKDADYAYYRALNALLKIRREETNETHKSFLQQSKTVELKKASTEALAKIEMTCRQEGFNPLHGPNPLQKYKKSFDEVDKQIERFNKLLSEPKK